MTKISSLSALTGAGVDQAADLLPIVDMSETGAARNKKITIAELLGLINITGLLDFKGSTDCSANPNYPAASKGDYYLVSVAGKIGGASGVIVTAGDSFFATADNAGGTQAAVGTSWTVIQGNINFTPVNIAGDTMTGDLVVPDEAYDATAWDGSLEVPTKNAVRDKIESLAGGGFTAASTTEILTGTDSAKGGTPDSIAALWEQGSDVASAAAVSLGEGGYFNITGTTTITDIDFATDKAGRKAWVKFAGVLTLTHNASTLILPTGASITTAAGDTACFISEGSDAVRCVAYNRASGAALAGGGSGAWTLIESLTPSAVASINSEAWAGGAYKALKFMFRLTASDDSTALSVRYKLNGAYKTSSNYRYGARAASSSGTGAELGATGTSLIIGGTGANGIGNNTLEHIAGEITIHRPFETTKPKALHYHVVDGAPSGAYQSIPGAGAYDGTDAANALEGLQFLISAGTMTGTIDVLGLN